MGHAHCGAVSELSSTSMGGLIREGQVIGANPTPRLIIVFSFSFSGGGVGWSFTDQGAKLPWALSAPRWLFWKRERGEGRKKGPGNMKMMAKPLLEAKAP